MPKNMKLAYKKEIKKKSNAAQNKWQKRRIFLIVSTKYEIAI